MDEFDGGPGKVLRARSLKRGKIEERISDRVSNFITFTFYPIYLL